jgi:hypothetical protein
MSRRFQIRRELSEAVVSNKIQMEMDLMDWQMQVISVVIHRLRWTLGLIKHGKMHSIAGSSDQLTIRQPQLHVYCANNGVGSLLRG